MPLASVIMATYKGKDFINTQLQSVLNQTFKNFEIVIIDDSSSDDTIRIAAKYIKSRKFLKDAERLLKRNLISKILSNNIMKSIKK